MRSSKRSGLGGAAGAMLLAAGLVGLAQSQAGAAVACQVSYSENAWNNGYVATVGITNTGDAWTSWQLRYTLSGNDQLSGGWGGAWSQSGQTVTATNASWNGSVPTGGSISVGAQFSFGGGHAAPGGFTVNGVGCNGAGPTTPPTSPPVTPTSQPTSQPTSPPTTPPVTGRPVGYASMNGGTTGGAGGGTVTVSNASQFTSAISGTAASTVQVNGTISLSGMVNVGSNKTIVGVGTAGRITGGGLNLDSSRNVIIRNLTFTDAGDDSINVQDESTNIWIDHNDLSNGNDGLIDIKRGSDFITVSWNKLHDHDKSMLLGHSDDNSAQDLGHLRVTYAYNWLEGTGQRHPRVRFANPVHVLNNYYNNIGSYGAASTNNAGVLVEANYFENVDRPTSIQEGSSPEGNIRVLNNHLVNSATPVTRNPGSVAAIPYSYSPLAASSVKATVTAGAGVGRI